MANALLRFYRAKIVTVEVVIVLFILGRLVSIPLAEQYYYNRYGSAILENTSFVFPNGTFCLGSDTINNYTGSNQSYKQVESQSNHLVTYSQIANTLPSVVVTIIFGPLTDRFGRKIGIIVPVAGSVLQYILTILVIHFDLHPYYFILTNFVGGVAGSFTCFLAASFAYIADVSSPRWRSLRIGIVESAMSFGGCAGTLLGGYWLHKVDCDFIPLYCFLVACCFFVLLYSAFAIPESLSREERREFQAKNPQGLLSYVQGLKLFLGGLPWRSTWKLYVAMLVIFVEGVNVFGATFVDVYFLKALPFDFNPLQIGIFEGVRSGSQGLYDLLFMGILVTLTVGDAWILLFSMTVHFASNLLLGFATKGWQLFASEY